MWRPSYLKVWWARNLCAGYEFLLLISLLERNTFTIFIFPTSKIHTFKYSCIPIVKSMILKSKAPFAPNSSSTSISSFHSSQPPHESELTYFPSLPKVRQRGYYIYTADKTNPKEKLCMHKTEICMATQLCYRGYSPYYTVLWTWLVGTYTLNLVRIVSLAYQTYTMLTYILL